VLCIFVYFLKCSSEKNLRFFTLLFSFKIIIKIYCFRWWNLPVSSLDLRAPLTVTPTVTIQEALDLLNKEGFDQVPVVNEAG
jgi:hypothetical protein